MHNLAYRLLRMGIAALLLAVFALPISFEQHTSAIAATPSIIDLQKQKQALEKQIKADEAKKQQKQEEQKKLQGQIGDLNTQIDGVEDKIEETQISIQTTEAAIGEKEQEISEKNRELTEQESLQAEAIRTIYQTGDPSIIEFLVGSMTFAEYLSYQQYLDSLENRIEQTINEVTRLRDELEGKKTELNQLENQQQAYQTALANQRQEKDRLLGNAKAVEERLAAQISEAQKVFADVNNELTKLMEAARKRAAQRARGEIPKGVSNVGFQYPTAFLYMSCQFGCRTPFQNFHTGVDLVNYRGTPVVAAADGVVTTMGRVSYGYGTYVIITHNERLATLYGHFQDYAEWLQVGQTVKRGDIIGYIGMTGWTTGPHLHFEIREYGIPDDPLEYLPSL